MFEAKSNLGLVLRHEYDDASNNNTKTAMYDSLRTNLPRGDGVRLPVYIVVFSSSVDARRFCSHKEVQGYLQSLQKRFNCSTCSSLTTVKECRKNHSKKKKKKKKNSARNDGEI